MGYLIGAVLALGVAAFAAVIGFSRDRAFYPTVLVVVASYYELFAVMGGATSALGPETLAFAVFAGLAALGFRFNLWIVAAALVGHGAFDFLRGDLISNPGVPAWWPPFCMTYDVAAGILLGMLLLRGSLSAAPAAGAGRRARIAP